jgi:hypothetical protein
MYIIVEFSKNGRAFPRTKEWVSWVLAMFPLSQGGDLRGGACIKTATTMRCK